LELQTGHLKEGSFALLNNTCHANRVRALEKELHTQPSCASTATFTVDAMMYGKGLELKFSIGRTVSRELPQVYAEALVLVSIQSDSTRVVKALKNLKDSVKHILRVVMTLS
jgi:hypothetical protein